MASRYGRLPGPARAAARFAVDRAPVTLGGRGLRYARWAKRFLTFAELPEEPRFRRSYTLYDPDDLAGLLSPDLGGQVDRVVDSHREIYTDNSLHDEVNRMCLADARLFLPGLNLSYTDRASMAASVEVRVPFVDPVVAQAAFAIPGRDKIRNRQGKLALKQAAEQWLPREIVYRPKASFGAPLRGWVRNDLREVINDVLVRGELVGSGMIRAGALDRLIADDRAGREDNAKQIWQLLTMELWYRNARSMGVAA
jgi:asparagine synthase (glutamine-hydrolysing)